jgi:hypothetical protein
MDDSPTKETKEEESKGTCCGRKAWLYPEMPWGAPPEVDARNMHGAAFLAIWEIVTFVCCLYVAWSVPYNVTFAEKQENILKQQGLPVTNDCVFLHIHEFPPMKFWMSIMDLVVDLIFYVDIVLNFHSASWEVSTSPCQRSSLSSTSILHSDLLR